MTGSERERTPAEDKKEEEKESLPAAVTVQSYLHEISIEEKAAAGGGADDDDDHEDPALLSPSRRGYYRQKRTESDGPPALTSKYQRVGPRSSTYTRRIKISKDEYMTNCRSPIHAAYIIKNKIGVGTWGAVHLAVERSSGYVRAIKKIPKKPSLDIRRFRQEMILLKGFDHPRIVRVYETYEDFANLYMVMEYCRGGELYQRMADEGPLPEPIAAYLMKQMLSAVAYCHSRNVVHRDIKPENFLFLEPDIRSPLKLLDFGLSKRADPETVMTSVVGTIYYLAPELLGGQYTYKADLWSMGIVMYALLTGTTPFQGDNETAVLRSIRDGNINYEKLQISNAARDLLRGLCRRDPQMRITANDALQHEWFQSQWPSPILHLSVLIPSSASASASTSIEDLSAHDLVTHEPHMTVSDGDLCLDDTSNKDSNHPLSTSDGGSPDYCCDFAELSCGHSRFCPKNSPPNASDSAVQPPSGGLRRQIPPALSAPPSFSDKPHLGGALTHLRKLGLQNPEEAALLANRLVSKWRHYASLSPLKKAILSLAAQQLEHARELSYIRAIFDLLDAGGDGVLTPAEVTSSLRALKSFNQLPDAKGKLDSSPIDRDAQFASEVGELAQYVDLDGNGTIEYSEFAAACLDASTYRQPAAGRAIFRLLDRDGDGRIGQGELRAALGWSKLDTDGDDDLHPISPDQEFVRQVINEADADHDGFIGSEDFAALLQENDDNESVSRLYDAAELDAASLNSLEDSPEQQWGTSSQGKCDRFDFSRVTANRSIAEQQQGGGGGGEFTEETLIELRNMKIERSRLELARRQYL